jgi:hypothetical protein
MRVCPYIGPTFPKYLSAQIKAAQNKESTFHVRNPHVFKKSGSHFPIQGARWVTWSKFHTENAGSLESPQNLSVICSFLFGACVLIYISGCTGKKLQ